MPNALHQTKPVCIWVHHLEGFQDSCNFDNDTCGLFHKIRVPGTPHKSMFRNTDSFGNSDSKQNLCDYLVLGNWLPGSQELTSRFRELIFRFLAADIMVTGELTLYFQDTDFKFRGNWLKFYPARSFWLRMGRMLAMLSTSPQVH